MTAPFVTPAPWKPSLQHPLYATEDTYRLAAEWLKDCPTVADWGGSTGFFGSCLPPSVKYTVVDGTVQLTDQVLADLLTYREPSDGILLRHVLEINVEWRTILRNALSAFRQRMVVVTHTRSDGQTAYVRNKSGWPIHNLSAVDVVAEMAPYLVSVDVIQTSHPETVYLLERG